MQKALDFSSCIAQDLMCWFSNAGGGEGGRAFNAILYLGECNCFNTEKVSSNEGQCWIMRIPTRCFAVSHARSTSKERKVA